MQVLKNGSDRLKPKLLWFPFVALGVGCGQPATTPQMTPRELKVITDHDARVQAIDEQDTIRYFQQNPVSPSKKSR